MSMSDCFWDVTSVLRDEPLQNGPVTGGLSNNCYLIDRFTSIMQARLTAVPNGSGAGIAANQLSVLVSGVFGEAALHGKQVHSERYTAPGCLSPVDSMLG